jgi:purine nucleosidase
MSFIRLFRQFNFNGMSFAQFKVILDADIDSDVDDVEALAMVHTLADQKKIDFLGVIVTRKLAG